MASAAEIGNLHTTLKTLPVHVQRTIMNYDLQRSARMRAFAGQRWLDSKAPNDWRLQMISISDGCVSSHVCMQKETGNPLVLAFRREPSLRGNDGRVTWAAVAQKFRFTGETGTVEARRCGFLQMQHVLGGKTILDSKTDCCLLNAAWEYVLQTFARRKYALPYQN